VVQGGRAERVGRTIGLIVCSNIGTTKVAAEQLEWTPQELAVWIKHGSLGLAPTISATSASARRRRSEVTMTDIPEPQKAHQLEPAMEM
jgi:hypothetical protein